MHVVVGPGRADRLHPGASAPPSRTLRALLALLLASAAVGGLLPGFAPAARAAATTATFAPDADARVEQAYPTTNFGSSTRLISDASPLIETYLRFSVAGVSGTVQQAKLRLYAYDGSPDGPAVYLTGSSWSETGITWSNRPARTSGVLDDKGSVPASAWTGFDVTRAISGNGTYSFSLASTSGDGTRMYSRQASSNKPQLVLTLDRTTTSAAPKVGAYYYPWYGPNGRHWDSGYLRRMLAERQAPSLGEYDSRSQATLDAHFASAQQYGVDFFICSWWGAGGYEDVTVRDYVLKSPSIGSTKIVIFYESISLLGLTNGVIYFDSSVEQKFLSDFDYLARTYFADSHYLKIDGKPVVYLYVTRIYRGNYAQAITNLRAQIRSRYGFDLYLVGDEVDWDGSPLASRIRLFDAITPYTMYSSRQTPGWPDTTGFLQGVRQRYDSFKAVADAEGVAFIPGTLPAFNDRGVRLAANHYALPHEVSSTYTDTYSLFSRFLNLSGSYVDPAAATLTVTSWNEWHEDTQIEPTASAPPSSAPSTYTTGYTYYSYGTKLLQLLKSFKDSYAPAP
ncbi:MAG: DNRLRE domain-containing protein [Chloroflexota bacterium]|nr:DNRLRE domain-containing protein [Chloroflexota bacterium]